MVRIFFPILSSLFLTSVSSDPLVEYHMKDDVLIHSVSEIMERPLPDKGPSVMPRPKAANVSSNQKNTIDSKNTNVALSAKNFNFLGCTYNDTPGYFPPDTDGAVGLSQYLVVVNGRVRLFDKATGTKSNVLDTDLAAFFASVTPAGFYVCDPHVVYDRQSGRWFITSMTFNNSMAPNRILIATSTESNITSSSNFLFSYIQVNSDFADYPTLGVDQNALYIGVNVFSSAGYYVGSDGYVVNKASLLAGSIAFTRFANLGLATPQGVNNFDSNPSFGYFIGNSYYATALSLVKIKDAATTPSIQSITDVTIPDYTSPMTVQSYRSIGIDGGDDRLLCAHIRNGVLYTSHTIATNYLGQSGGNINVTANGSRWYQINPLTSTLSTTGLLYDTSNNGTRRNHYWMPSVMTNGPGAMILGCSQCNSAGYPNAAYALRYKNDAAGTIRSPVVYTASTSVYSVGNMRWGDYSVSSLDPEDNMTFWTIQEYSSAPNIWATRVASVLSAPPATPSKCIPSSLKKGQSGTVTIQATSTNGSSFYDPGVGFPKRLSVSFGSGVTVNSVQYINGTTLQANITCGNSTGDKTVTVTNPDGQQSSKANIFSISR
jgi:hypothetical protein